MFGLLTGGLTKWLIIGGGVAMLAGAIWLQSWRLKEAHESLGAAKAEVARVAAIANQNAAELDRQKAFVQAGNQANAEKDRLIAEERAKSAEFQRRIANVKDGCVISDDLRNAIRLRLWGDGTDHGPGGGAKPAK